MPVILKAEGVEKQYGNEKTGVHALRGIDLEIEEGMFYAIIGKSGSGKSTLLHILGGLDKPTKGAIFLEGENISALRGNALALVRRRRIGFVFQSYNLLEEHTVMENILLPIHLDGRRPDMEFIDQVVDALGIRDKLSSYPDELSGGQKQRVAIARALANDPKVLLCDEATSALDPQTTKSILGLLKKVNEELSITIVLITHEMAVVKDICDRVAIMELGRVVEQGTAEEIFVHPKEHLTRDFISTASNMDKFLELVEQNNELTRLGTGDKLVLLTYSANNAGEPVISYLAEAFSVKANIIYGNIDILKGKTIGKLGVALSGEPEQMEKALAYIKEQKVEVEVVKE